ncbi:DUF1343 domain-containing protein [Litoribacter ruber]|uniref:DUF1343 domain-containing protein n=1 Tax=Litoribacter ruber TaxID=702568 RepID=A0AAP2G3K0_9BACT|nr:MULTISPECIES: DUF1343 domain-containing protein [Litoribacter]MBS9523086.1 DUF1343 domain-containing protein [Litoribacter alkaliphilus]MBT0810751.1 DUF1343 domain-containing protein [Litoribacter ruber]
MKHLKLILILGFLANTLAFCSPAENYQEEETQKTKTSAITGADRHSEYLPMIEGKNIGLVVNQTSILPQKDNLHLVDFLLGENQKVKKVYVPEHGFRGDADAGEKVENEVDQKTGLPVISLYGNNKKPSKEALSGIDILIYDLQDVGVRFYTYISTLHYVMEAAAEQNIPVIILDRPNPNGDYVDGPVLKEGFTSFVGMHPIPVVHGLTVAELAQMINGEGWLKNKVKADIKIVKTENWDHSQPYSLPVKPSPNLPNDISIRLYPSLCYFEGTDISLGRGTTFPFQVYGYPDESFGEFSFTPTSIPGMSKNPPHQDKTCYGKDLRNEDLSHQFTLTYLLDAYKKSGKKEKFFNAFFDKLAGTDQLRKDILAGKPESDIRASWDKDLAEYEKLREKYLIY